MPDARRTFGPLVLLGLSTAALTAVAAAKQMMRITADSAEALGIEKLIERLHSSEGDLSSQALPTIGGDLPLAGTLALVLLAGWGVVLVTRGRARLGFQWMTFLAAAGVLVALVAGYVTGTDGYRDNVLERIAGQHSGSALEVEPTGWFWTACVAAALAAVVSGVSLRFVSGWPTMGGRYDAPGSETSAPSSAESGEKSNLDLWKAMDEGDDPTM